MPFVLPSVLKRLTVQLQQHLHRTVFLTLALALLITLSILAISGRLPRIWTAFRSDISTQGYTELAFDNSAFIPTKVNSNGTVSFSFTLHNVEGSAMTYPYEVLSKTSSDTLSLDSGTITLPSGAATTQKEFLHLTLPTSSQQIIVNLPNQQQAINFSVKGETL